MGTAEGVPEGRPEGAVSEERQWVRPLLERAMALQRELLKEYPLEKRAEGHGRAACLIVEGQGTYYLVFDKNNGLQWKPDGMPVRNTIWTTESALQDLLLGRVSLDEAVRHGLVKVSGEHSLYDTGEFLEIWEKVVERILRPLVDRAAQAAGIKVV
jgi:hypothetical protein